MTEITIEKLEYSGSAVESAVQSATGMTDPVQHVRLDLHVDDNVAREPFLIRANVDGPGFGSGPWSLPIDRTWFYEDRIELEVWVSPAVSTTDTIYHQVDTKVGSKTVTASAGTSGSFDLFGGNLTVPYSCSSGPSEQYEAIDGDDDSTESHLYRTPAIESAMADFDPDDGDDDGLAFIDEADVVAVLDSLTSRVDTTGNNYPDGAIELVDQQPFGLCVSASLLTHFACFWPRRLIELVRSVYQPIAFDEHGHRECGFLGRSTTITFRPKPLTDTYESHLFRADEAKRSTTSGDDVVPTTSIQLLVQYLLRASLAQLPPLADIGIGRPGNEDQFRKSGIGMDSWETAGVARDVLGLEAVSVQDHRLTSAYNDGYEIIVQAAQKTTSGELGVLGIDSVLCHIAPNTSGPEGIDDPEEDHAITVLGFASSGGDYDVTFQNSWGGGADAVTVTKRNLKSLVYNVVVSGGLSQ